jgi:peptide/nickel transport system substrate-binding protein
MRNRLLALIATSAIIGSACGTTASTSPSTGSAAPASAGTAESASPAITVPPIPDVSATKYKPEAVGHKGGSLILGISGDPDTVWTNIYGTFANDADAFGPALWGLWNNTNDLKYYGQLAADVPTVANKEVVVNGDKMDLTINMVPGAQWSDGQPINCDDVIYMWHWQLDPGQAEAGNVQGTQGYEDIDSIDGAGTEKCTVHFKKVYEPYLTLWSPLFPAHYLKTVPNVADHINKLYTDKGLKDAVWSGPYIPTAWAHDAQINYVPNAKFWSTIKKSDPPFDTVTMKFYADTDAQIAGYQAGEVDASLEFNQNQVAAMSAIPEAEVSKIPSVTYEQHSWNLADLVKKFGDKGGKAMMEALHYATDKEAINQTITGGAVTPTCSFTNDQAWFFDPSIQCYQHDADKAAKTLADAGFTKGSDGLLTLNGNKADLLACTRSDRQYRLDTLNLLGSQLLPLGIKLTVKGSTSAILFGNWGTTAADTPCNMTHGNFDVAEFAWVSTPDPNSIYALYLSAKDPSKGDHSGQNYIRVINPDLDTLLTDSLRSVDLLKVKDDMSKIQKLYIDPANAFPEIPLYDWTTVNLKSPKLHNVEFNGSASVQTWNLEDWWKDG